MKSVCPQIKAVWEENSKVFSPDSNVRGLDEHLFRMTHRAIEVYWDSEGYRKDSYLERSMSEKTLISENTIVEFLKRKSGDKRILLFEGPAGVGKSELCMTLAFAFKDSNRLLWIPKRASPLQIMTQIIPEFIRKHTAKPEGTYPEGIDEHDEVQLAFLAREISGGLPARIKSDPALKKKIEIKLADVERIGRSLQAKITSVLPTYITEGERSVDLFDERDGIEITQMLGCKEISKDELVRINKMASDIILKAIVGASDLVMVLDEASRILEKRHVRPLVILEDIRKLGAKGFDLLNYFFDMSAKNWDIVIAGTTGAMLEFLPGETEKQRSFHFSFVPAEDDQVAFLNEETAVDFIKPYLSFFKTRDPCKACSSRLCGDEEGRALFPFTADFVRTFYGALRKKTPRNLVNCIHGMLEGPCREGSPPSEWRLLSREADPGRNPNTPHLPDELLQRDEGVMYRMGQWYGRLEHNRLLLNMHVPQSFGYQVPADFPSDGHWMVLSSGPQAAQGPVPTQLVEGTGIPSELMALQNTIPSWLQPGSVEFGSDEIREVGELVQLGAEKLLNSLYLSFAAPKHGVKHVTLKIANPLFWKGEEPRSPLSQEVDHTKLTPSIARPLLQLGFHISKTATRYDPNQLLLVLSETPALAFFIEDIASRLLTKVERILFGRDMTIEDAALGACLLLWMLTAPTDFDMSVDSILKVHTPKTGAGETAANVLKALAGASRYTGHDLKHLENLAQNEASLEDLFYNFFEVATGILDIQKIEQSLKKLKNIRGAYAAIQAFTNLRVIPRVDWLEVNGTAVHDLLLMAEEVFQLTIPRIVKGSHDQLGTLQTRLRRLKESFDGNKTIQLVESCKKLAGSKRHLDVAFQTDGYELADLTKEVTVYEPREVKDAIETIQKACSSVDRKDLDDYYTVQMLAAYHYLEAQKVTGKLLELHEQVERMNLDLKGGDVVQRLEAALSAALSVKAEELRENAAQKLEELDRLYEGLGQIGAPVQRFKYVPTKDNPESSVILVEEAIRNCHVTLRGFVNNRTKSSEWLAKLSDLLGSEASESLTEIRTKATTTAQSTNPDFEAIRKLLSRFDSIESQLLKQAVQRFKIDEKLLERLLRTGAAFDSLQMYEVVILHRSELAKVLRLSLG